MLCSPILGEHNRSLRFLTKTQYALLILENSPYMKKTTECWWKVPTKYSTLGVVGCGSSDSWAWFSSISLHHQLVWYLCWVSNSLDCISTRLIWGVQKVQSSSVVQIQWTEISFLIILDDNYALADGSARKLQSCELNLLRRMHLEWKKEYKQERDVMLCNERLVITAWHKAKKEPKRNQRGWK